MKFKVSIFCLALLCLATASIVEAKTFYISPSGSNSNDCSTSGAQNINTPKQTLTNFIQQCGPAGSGVFVAGDTLFLRAGVYNERINFNTLRFPVGTSWTNKILISAHPGNCGKRSPTSAGICEQV